jgi:hypothetical protein
MSEFVSSELQIFIERFCKEVKIKNIQLKNLQADTSVDLDLNIFDLDMDLFISDFVKFFEIDYTGFSWKKGGYPSAPFSTALIRTFLDYKQDWVKALARRFYTPKVYISDLQMSIKTKKLQVRSQIDGKASQV